MKLQSFSYIAKITSVFTDTEKRRKLGMIAGFFYACVVLAIVYAMVDILQNGQEAVEIEEKVAQPIIEQASSSIQITVPSLPEVKPEQGLPETREVPSKSAWRQNAAVWTETNLPKIAIVIDDLGLDEEASIKLAELKGPLTLAYLPYAEGLKWQTEAVRKAGHELMVHLPMQPHNAAADPGPNALIDGLVLQEFERRIDWNLHQFEGFVGVNNHMGSKLTEDPALMVRVMAHLQNGGWVFLDSLTSPKTVAERAAKASGVPTIARDVFLDNDRDEQLIWEQMLRAERIAKHRGYAVVIGHPYPETMAVLKRWTADIEQRGIALVPVSQLIAEKEGVAHLADTSTKFN
ncbi:divergent polysaccharide deacetylase family protein [Kordiimonas laminariae]|uniref:divergent polysaccharide deacetylase family protein n=1 Tax=Kordiimonas laminariae TaxID=2917717 RepID=UPI001FF0E653|nr:divergent polysaccharide deacetylase family protein [Kordiimonas laminariae]